MILIDSFFRAGKNYLEFHFKSFQKNVNILLKKKDDIEISSDSDENNSDEENFDEEILEKEKKIFLFT